LTVLIKKFLSFNQLLTRQNILEMLDKPNLIAMLTAIFKMVSTILVLYNLQCVRWRKKKSIFNTNVKRIRWKREKEEI
jgi:hypothetical protein